MSLRPNTYTNEDGSLKVTHHNSRVVSNVSYAPYYSVSIQFSSNYNFTVFFSTEQEALDYAREIESDVRDVIQLQNKLRKDYRKSTEVTKKKLNAVVA